MDMLDFISRSITRLQAKKIARLMTFNYILNKTKSVISLSRLELTKYLYSIKFNGVLIFNLLVNFLMVINHARVWNQKPSTQVWKNSITNYWFTNCSTDFYCFALTSNHWQNNIWLSYYCHKFHTAK